MLFVAAQMLSSFTKARRIKAALALALVYALCALAPSTALAFMDSGRAAHCLTEAHGAAATHVEKANTHTHADGTAHSHHQQDAVQNGTDADGKAAPEQCCGLFCITALAIEPEAMQTRLIVFSTVYPPLADVLGGLDPERIIRPPIA